MNALDVQSGVKHHQSNLNALAVSLKKILFSRDKRKSIANEFLKLSHNFYYIQRHRCACTDFKSGQEGIIFVAHFPQNLFSSWPYFNFSLMEPYGIILHMYLYKDLFHFIFFKSGDEGFVLHIFCIVYTLANLILINAQVGVTLN